jgi:hypothetical protein
MLNRIFSELAPEDWLRSKRLFKIGEVEVFKNKEAFRVSEARFLSVSVIC